MCDAAAAVFAERGFAVSTRDLARALGVTQALIYKHFGSKDRLISETLNRLFAVEHRPSWAEVFAATPGPLAVRLAAAYQQFILALDPHRLRLFIWAGLQGSRLAGRRGAALTRGVFSPLITALRAEAGLPGFETTPMMRGEREIAMMLHGSVVFMAIRQHIYGMPMPEDRPAVVDLYVSIFAVGALAALRELHAGGLPVSLRVEQLTPRKG
jgi:AcrR family transcriptional regulator